MAGDRGVPRSAATPHPTERSARRDPIPPRHDQVAGGDDVPAAARDLLLHRLDPATGDCMACGQPCPCPHANAAASVLAKAGHWKQPPLNPVPETQTRPTQPRRPWRALSRALLRRGRPAP